MSKASEWVKVMVRVRPMNKKENDLGNYVINNYNYRFIASDKLIIFRMRASSRSGEFN